MQTPQNQKSQKMFSGYVIETTPWVNALSQLPESTPWVNSQSQLPESTPRVNSQSQLPESTPKVNSESTSSINPFFYV